MYFSQNAQKQPEARHCEHRGGNGRGDCGHPDIKPTTQTATGGIAVSVSTAADAFGVATRATTTMDIHTIDRGLASYAYGSVSTAASASGEGAYASTVTNVGMIGADIGYVSSIDTVSDTGAVMTTTTSFAGINLKFDLPGCVGGVQSANDVKANTSRPASDGNVAEFKVNADARGDNTSVTVNADATAMDIGFASSTVSAVVAASSTSTYLLFEGTKRDEKIDGTRGTDLIYGGRGDDTINGLNGDDWLFGDRGSDKLTGGSGSDTIFGGNDDDTITGGDGNDWIFGGDDKDELDGGAGDDLLLGEEGGDVLRGGVGNDVLWGGEGRDRLFGNDGSDVFRLGAPRGDDDDTYTGGAGADFYQIVDRFDDDVILDFSVRDGDRLVLDGETESCLVSMHRSSCDLDDLEIKFGSGASASTLLLDEFFKVNSGIIAFSKSVGISLADVSWLYQAIFHEGSNAVLDQAEANFTFGHLLATLD
ncbi:MULTISPECIES: calcium-binding protein [unclassified Rhizobium]|uniref:calcium-binding protein n=1 Tax=unclassified Rhizobium TaxID=2613769 RepID=UPI000697B9E0|nr:MULTISPECIES: calcium-binding protein [unclassified Rhizobium]